MKLGRRCKSHKQGTGGILSLVSYNRPSLMIIVSVSLLRDFEPLDGPSFQALIATGEPNFQKYREKRCTDCGPLTSMIFLDLLTSLKMYFRKYLLNFVMELSINFNFPSRHGMFKAATSNPCQRNCCCKVAE